MFASAVYLFRYNSGLFAVEY
eukprot:COSAG03_NODE_26433_length_259_cov_0.643750_1_plen_20_part_01